MTSRAANVQVANTQPESNPACSGPNKHKIHTSVIQGAGLLLSRGDTARINPRGVMGLINHSMIVFEHVLCAWCAGLCMFYVRCLVCVVSGTQYVLCVGFSLCCVQFASTHLVASLRACLASLGREWPKKGTRKAPNKRQREDCLCHVGELMRGGATHHPPVLTALRTGRQAPLL